MKLKALRLLLLIFWEYLRRNGKWVASGVILLVILVILQFKFNFIAKENVLRIGLVGTFQEHDLPQEVTRLLSSGLVEASSEGRIAPLLVSGWEVNNDATQFKFKLKDNLKWTDNTTVKSSELEFSIPNTEISYPDKNSIQFNLKQPYSPLPSLLLKPVFKKGALVGTGPYSISKIEKSRIFITKIILKSNDPKLPTLHFRFYPSEKVAITGFNLGEVQVLLGLSNPKALIQNALVLSRQSTDFTKIVTVLFKCQTQT